MACGDKFTKLKSANHQILAICQNLPPPNLPDIRYTKDIHLEAKIKKIQHFLTLFLYNFVHAQ